MIIKHLYTYILYIKQLRVTLKRVMRDYIYVQSTIHRYKKIHFLLNKMSWQILAE
jgi:hypothetical protein